MQIDVEKLKEETKKLSDLLNDPHVGLSTWNDAVGHQIAAISLRWFTSVVDAPK